MYHDPQLQMYIYCIFSVQGVSKNAFKMLSLALALLEKNCHLFVTRAIGNIFMVNKSP